MSRARIAGIALLLFAVVLALYWRTGGHGFLIYDDDVYVTANPAVLGGLSAEGAGWAFTTGHAANWHPLTWLSHQLDVEVLGLDPGAHHRVSAALHALAAALAFLALRALTGATVRSALAAALFALHPLRVESVAWIAERKDVLSGVLALATLLAWATYARRGGAARYGLALALFTLGLLAKPMLVTLPFVLLLLDAWPLGRWRGARGESPGSRSGLLIEKLPFLALAAASAVVTLLVQRAGGAMDPGSSIGLAARVANAVEATGTYVVKTLVPTGLAVIHPHPALVEPERGALSAGVLAALALLVLVTAAAVALRRRAPPVLVGWLAFLGMLVPVSGLVQVGLHGWAERYTYLPSIGLAVALVWGGAELARTGRAQRALGALALLACVGLALLTHRQLAHWKDDVALFTRALAVEERNPVAHVNLGRALERTGDLAGAERHYARAVELAPSLAEARVNLAAVLEALGRPAEARAELERALADRPDLGPALARLGWMLAELGDDAEGIAHLRRAVALEPPDLPLVANSLAWVLATSRAHAEPAEALALAEGLCRATGHRQAGFLETLAAALARLGRHAEAAEWQARAVALVPPAQRGPLEERLALYRAGRAYLKTP